MGEVARNSLKGYTYQQSVFILFLGLMDTERTIGKIIVEALDLSLIHISEPTRPY